MLLRFSAGNHLSIREPVELSLVASALKDDKTGLIECIHAPNGKALPSAVIYGANASGKSNLISALELFCEVILHSHRQGKPGGGVPHAPFALDQAFADKPSTFEADFVIENVLFHYGFAASEEAFLREWLYAYTSGGRRRILFERAGQRFSFGSSLKGRNKIIADLTRPNSLFVSAAAQNNHEELSKISGYFESVHFDSDTSVAGGFAARQLADDGLDERVIGFLDKIGTGVVRHERKEQAVPEEARKFSRALTAALKEVGAERAGEPLGDRDKDFYIQLAHRTVNGEDVLFDIDQESEGTKRLLMLLGPVFRALDRGTVIVIDELNASLHTQVCEAVLVMFSSKEINPLGAQLITTTHDTNLLRSPFLRRDQIWFTEKDQQGATHLYPLTDIRTRKGDNIEKGYLQGRFGAIPYAGPVSDLVV